MSVPCGSHTFSQQFAMSRMMEEVPAWIEYCGQLEISLGT